LYSRQSNEGSLNAPKTTPNEAIQNGEVDVPKFPEVHLNDIEKLRFLSVNINTSGSTKHWMNLFKPWCIWRRMQNVNIETMPTEYLDKLLGKFYAEIKTRRWRLRARIIENYAV
jgi:hypothetical protein